jgi:hypothetical protein
MATRMTTDLIPPVVQNYHQSDPLQNGFDPDCPHSTIDQSSPPSTKASNEQLPQGGTTRPKHQGDTAELVVASMLDQHFAGVSI